MKHLDDATAIVLAEGVGDATAGQHAAGCEGCGRRVERLRRLLGVLTEGGGEAPPLRLQRWARAYSRTAAATRPRFSLLTFLSEGAPLQAAVRGIQARSSALLYGDERYQLDLRVDPAGGEWVRLHGQIVPFGQMEAGGWEVIAVTAEGRTLRTTADDAGEFWLEAHGRWHEMSLVAVHDLDRLVVLRLIPREVESEQ